MPKVMTVEDSGLIRAIIKKFVTEAGFETIEAANGKDAVVMYLQAKPDMVFMDINLPGISGLEAAEEILKQDPDANIVMCTVFDKEEYRKKASEIGVKGYIVKPFSRTEIFNALKKLIAAKDKEVK